MIEHISDVLWRVSPTMRDRLHCLMHDYGVKMELIEQEIVWMLCFHAPRCKRLSGKVLAIEGNEHLGMRLDRRGEHMPIVGIWQRDGLDQRLVPGDQAIAYRSAHKLLPISSRVRARRCASRFGRLAASLSKVSSKICSVHLAWTKPAIAIRISRSHSVDG